MYANHYAIAVMDKNFNLKTTPILYSDLMKSIVFGFLKKQECICCLFKSSLTRRPNINLAVCRDCVCGKKAAFVDTFTGSFCFLMQNGQFLSLEEVNEMTEQYRSFTEDHTTTLVVDPHFRNTPIPHTGVSRSWEGFRSHEVLCDGQYVRMCRSHSDKSWKTNTKARKAWAKHKQPHCHQTKQELAYQENYSSYELDEYDHIFGEDDYIFDKNNVIEPI